MNYILTYLIIPLEQETENSVRCWLDDGHYPNYIDRENGKIIAFNLSIEIIEKFVNQFGIDSWECGQDAYPEGYVGLCKNVNNVIANNVSAYFRFATRQSLYRPLETYSDIYDLLSAAYLHDGYKAWRLRYYLSANCCEKSEDTFDPLLHAVQTALDDVSINSAIVNDQTLVPVANLWIDKNPLSGRINRIYVGWFCKNFDGIMSIGGLSRFGIITPIMNDRLQELGIPRNTDNPKTIESFVEKTEYADTKPSCRIRHGIDPEAGIYSTSVIPYLECEDPEKVLPLRAVPYAIDRIQHRILIFNIHRDYEGWLSRLRDTSLLRRAYVTYNRIPEYSDLYEYMERRIEINLHESNISKATVRNAYPSQGMCGYYIRLRCFSGLMNLDPHNLPVL